MMKENSAILRILLHAFFLISVNLFSIMVAVVGMYFLKNGNQELLQTAIALFINLGIYLLVFKLMSGMQSQVMLIDNIMMMIIILMSSLALFPAVFYPLNYLIRNEWSTFDNILEFWPFQLFTNGICLLMNYFIIAKSRL